MTRLPFDYHYAPMITLASYSGKRNVSVRCPSVCPSVCPVRILTETHQGAARDVASVHFSPIIRTTDILVVWKFLFGICLKEP